MGLWRFCVSMEIKLWYFCDGLQVFLKPLKIFGFCQNRTAPHLLDSMAFCDTHKFQNAFFAAGGSFVSVRHVFSAGLQALDYPLPLYRICLIRSLWMLFGEMALAAIVLINRLILQSASICYCDFRLNLSI